MLLSAEDLKTRLENLSGREIELRLNQNTGNFLIVSWGQYDKPRWHKNRLTKNFMKVSIHKIFLDAPDDVIDAVGQFLRRATRKSRIIIRRYINENYDRVEAPSRPTPLVVKGKCFNLATALNRVNRIYFDGKLDLKVSWAVNGNAMQNLPGKRTASKPKRRRRASQSIQFACYDEKLRLIRVNPRLDNPQVPPYFLEYVLYHEMLHAVIPPRMSDDGRLLAHTPEFHRHERLFKEYKAAREWEDRCLKII